ncbi:MAG: hypothetical protein R2838_17570 [Caldilineaceae bacterium]
MTDNLAPGGYYQLYAFDRIEDTRDGDLDQGWRGLRPGEVEQRFTPALRIVELIEGRAIVRRAAGTSCNVPPSAADLPNQYRKIGERGSPSDIHFLSMTSPYLPGILWSRCETKPQSTT